MSKKGLRFGASMVGMLGGLVAAPAFAQAPAPAEPAAEEEIIITGSFIRGTPEDAALPVDVISTEELQNRGSPTMTQLIKTIPSSGAVIGENNRFGAGNGTSTINLRSLNSASTGARTLVLFNGRRFAGSTRSLGSVDVNLLPGNAIGRLEVLKDGAAATYGSDAIAGVVNFISRTDLNGFESTGQYQFIDGSEGDYSLGGAYGFKGDSADALFAVEYNRRSELEVAERDWALRTGPEGFLENPVGGWAATGNPGLYMAPSGAGPVGSPNTGFTSTNGLFTLNLPDIGCAANGGAPYSQRTLATTATAPVSTTQCAFQYTVFDNLVEDEKRLKAFGQVNIDMTDTLKFHGEAQWARNETPLQSWAMTGPNQFPAPILASGGSAGGGTSPLSAAGTLEQSNFYIPATNPGLVQFLQQVGAASCAGPVYPYGVDALSCAAGLAVAVASSTNAASYGVVTSTTSWRPIGFGGNPYTADSHSHYTYKTDTWRAVGELSGEMPWGIGWNLGLTYQQLDFNYNIQDSSVNRIQLAMRGYGSSTANPDQCTAAETSNFTTNAGNAALGCYYFNPFANAFATSLSGNTANPYYVAANGAIPGFNEAVAQRPGVVDWFEEEQYNQNSTRLFEADFITNGQTDVKLFGEDGISWALGGQARYDRITQTPQALYDANATPCVDSPPFGDGAPYCATTANGPFLFNANLRPYDASRNIYSVFGEAKIPVTDTLEITLAGRYENYSGQGTTFNPKVAVRWQALDWLAFRGSAGSTYRAPQANFTTNTFTRGLSNASLTYRASDLYGNPDLQPEEANTTSLGILFDNDRIKASVDWWRFDFANPMTAESVTDMYAAMFPTAAPDHCLDAPYDNLETRFVFSGPCAAGNITSYRTKYINGGSILTEGLDFQLNADIAEIAGGDLSAGFDGTYLLTYDEAPTLIEGIPLAAGVVDRVGTYRASVFTGYNQTRANMYANYEVGPHNFRWQTRYVSGTRQTETTPLAFAANPALTAIGSADIEAYWQNDVTYRADLPAEAQLTLGVQNVFDEEPPFALGTQYNYDPGSGTPLGRVFVVGLKKQF